MKCVLDFKCKATFVGISTHLKLKDCCVNSNLLLDPTEHKLNSAENQGSYYH